MQEGTFSLMQMAKTSAALGPPGRGAACPLSALLTDPTSAASPPPTPCSATCIVAEPGAIIGFAGPRVIEQTIRQKLPDGFQTAEFLIEHGHDRPGRRRAETCRRDAGQAAGLPRRPTSRSGRPQRATADGRSVTDAAQLTVAARPGRPCSWPATRTGPTTLEYIGSSARRLHRAARRPRSARRPGDRRRAWAARRPAGDGGRPPEGARHRGELIARNFGMPQPEGYRKALRLMRYAEKFGMPVITLVDTPGRLPRLGRPRSAARRSRSRATSWRWRGCRCRSSCMVIGEGGSGGALALGVGDRVLMLENAYLLGDQRPRAARDPVEATRPARRARPRP